AARGRGHRGPARPLRPREARHDQPGPVVREAVRRPPGRREGHGPEVRLLLARGCRERRGPAPHQVDDRPRRAGRPRGRLGRHRPRRGERRRAARDRVPAHRRRQGLRHEPGLVHRAPGRHRADGAALSVEASPELLEGLERWRSLEPAQQPVWPDEAKLAQVTAKLASLPPLVFAGEADVLTDKLAAAGRGEAFVLQGGDCAETFAEATADNIRNKIKTILQMAVVLTHGASLPIVKIGRMAGQYAKPRSSGTETRDGVTLPAFRGDIINGHAFT